MAEKSFVQFPSLSIFRANKSKNGHASRFQLSRKFVDGKLKVTLFLETAKQVGELDANGNANYAWGNSPNKDKGQSVTIKLGNADVGELLAVLRGVKKMTGSDSGNFKGTLFHKNTNGSSTVGLGLMEQDGKVTGYSLSVTKKTDKDNIRCSHSVSFGEAELLRVFLERSLVEMNQWFLPDILPFESKAKPEKQQQAQEPQHDEYQDPYDTVTSDQDLPF